MIYTGCSPLLFSTKMKIEQEATWRLYKTENFMEQNAGLDFFIVGTQNGYGPDEETSFLYQCN